MSRKSTEVEKIIQKLHEKIERIEIEINRIEQKLDSILEKPAPITKENAVGIATRFAELKDVRAIRQPQVISSHTRFYNIEGNDGKGDLIIGVNPSTGEVIKLVKQCPYPGVNLENSKISEEEAIGKAQEFLSQCRLPPIPKGFAMEKPRLKTTWNKKHWEIKWLHRVDDVQVQSDFVYFLVSAETGDIASYSKVFHDIEVSLKPKIDQDQAIEHAKEVLGKGNLEHYDPNMKVLKTILKIVYPNYYFQEWTYQWSERQCLAWIVQFGVEEEPAIDIWLDAQSGELLGGEIYERPVPELWGVPDQTADIFNIWEPALDLMQYNTQHTFLGDATESDIINSIANNEYFILQTHGGTTATAEYSTIHHSGTIDERRLTPDEVPTNNLRYALLSHCHSGHDGTGQDFKDEFIDKGADVFQGYSPAINPDPYEISLVRYLAEGQSLWNAHNNAVADTNPWFDIIIEYGPPLYCYNQLRLAPLHVDVYAPSSDWFTAVITTTVRNRESARQTTATNVKAELQLPSGFSIISGANPQTTPALYYNHTWTAQWTVHAPILTFGTKTFDVIVWSDNLGVEVDDFDNPYHKVDVTFSYFILAVFEYLEIFKWWRLAEKIYTQLPELGEIIEICTELEVYKNLDDIEKKPKQFLELMMKMVELENSFGQRLLEQKDIDRKAVHKYLDPVKAKKEYLIQIQEEGLKDLKEAVTKLSKLQIQINLIAVEAFLKKRK